MVDDLRRGVVDFVDYHLEKDADFMWLLIYQDCLTKFCFLRPLRSNLVLGVAVELLKIFQHVGFPDIFQSYIAREFSATVIREMKKMLPYLKLINGQHPQGQNETYAIE